LDAIRFYTPDVVVLPDFLLEEWDKTYAAAIGFLDRLYSEWVGLQFMYVPQSTPGKVVEFIEGMVRALEDERIGWIGIPRALSTDISPDPLARVNLCNYLKEHYPDIKVHALGMVKGNIAEMDLLEKEGCDSIDSSAPVWRGWNGFSLTDEDDIKRWDEEGSEVNFDDIAPISITDRGREINMKGAKQLIEANLKACGVPST
jgi:hypothetical protein